MTLKVATFNIWFDHLYMLERMRLIVKEILEESVPIDVIAFQEVTAVSLEYFQKSPLKDRYYFMKKKLTKSYDTVILLRKDQGLGLISYNCVEFPDTAMGRGLEIIKIYNHKAQKYYLIATTHLESQFHTNEIKLNQFKNSFQTLEKLNQMTPEAQKASLTILMGDTNIINPEESQFKVPDGWSDIYLELNPPKNLKYTYDYSMNNNVYLKKKSRLDRIYYQSSSMKPNSFAFLGQEPNQEGIYPSDHFGILSTFSSD